MTKGEAAVAKREMSGATEWLYALKDLLEAQATPSDYVRAKFALLDVITGGVIGTVPDVLAKLARSANRVCRFVDSAGKIFGTGFLVGPDFVMTAAHVLFFDNMRPRRDPTTITVEFETLLIHPKAIAQVNTLASALAAAWLVDPLLTSGGIADREIADLDYAVVRLATAAGDELVEPSTKRGWINILKVPPFMKIGRPLHVVQYTDRTTVKHSIGHITEFSDSRVSYNASTLGGASGAPVLSDEFEVAALHVSGPASDDGFNVGIPIRRIKESLDARGIVLPQF